MRLRSTWLKRALATACTLFVLSVVFNELLGTRLLRPHTEAPALALPLSTGKALHFPGEQEGVTLLAFWAEWCGPCRREVPILREVHRHLQAEGGQVVGVSINAEDLEDSLRRASAIGIDYPVAVADTQLLEAYRVSKLPTLYVLSPSGSIEDAFVGNVSAETLLAAAARARRP